MIRRGNALDRSARRLNGVLDEPVDRGPHLWLAVLTAPKDRTTYAANTSPIFTSLENKQSHQCQCQILTSNK